MAITKKKSIRITAARLKRLHACRDQLEKFCELYPEGVTVTRDNVLAVTINASDAGLDIHWVVARMISSRAATTAQAAAIRTRQDVSRAVFEFDKQADAPNLSYTQRDFLMGVAARRALARTAAELFRTRLLK